MRLWDFALFLFHMQSVCVAKFAATTVSLADDCIHLLQPGRFYNMQTLKADTARAHRTIVPGCTELRIQAHRVVCRPWALRCVQVVTSNEDQMAQAVRDGTLKGLGLESQNEHASTEAKEDTTRIIKNDDVILTCFILYIYVIDLKVLVRSFNCESRACYVGNPRESFFSSSRK
jgi:hypothetical protein